MTKADEADRVSSQVVWRKIGERIFWLSCCYVGTLSILQFDEQAKRSNADRTYPVANIVI